MDLIFNRFYERCAHKWYGISLINIIKYLLSRDIFRMKLKIRNKGSIRISKWIVGSNNVLVVEKGGCLNKVTVKIKGSNNRIIIGSNTVMGKNCKIYMFGNNLELIIGEGCSFNHDDELLVQEDNSKIHIGNGCMFSHHINVRTSDAHPIYFCDSKQRSNVAKNVYIGNHVWIGANVIIQKGSKIGDGCVVATYSVVNHRISSYDREPCKVSEDCITICNSIIAGIPAKVVKKGIFWERKFS